MNVSLLLLEDASVTGVMTHIKIRMKASSIEQLTVRRKFLVNHCLGLLGNQITSSFPHSEFGTC
jgi:hypothetical protein